MGDVRGPVGTSCLSSLLRTYILAPPLGSGRCPGFFGRPVSHARFEGAAYAAAGDVPSPRADPTDTAYRTTSGNLGYRGDGPGIAFSVWRGCPKACEVEAVLGDGLIRLSLGSASPDWPSSTSSGKATRTYR
jgi:hypothetical protein